MNLLYCLLKLCLFEFIKRRKKNMINKLNDISKNDIYKVWTFEDEFDNFLIFLKENEDTIKTRPDISIESTMLHNEILLLKF